MTVPSLALWQTGTDSQKLLRMGLGGSVGRPTAVFGGGVSPTTAGGSHGVVGGNDFNVTGTSLTLAVAAGGAFINGTSSIDQGVYYGYNNASQNVVLNAHNTQARTDLVILQVKDNAEDSSGATSLALDKVTGTPGGGVPTVPAGSLVLAQVAVPANSGATTVTDTRRFAAGLGGWIRCKSTQRPTGAALWLGQHIIETDTGARLWYDGSAWQYAFKPRASFTPTATGWTPGNGTWSVDWYIKEGECTYTGSFVLGSTTAIPDPTQLRVSLPIACAGSLRRRPGSAGFLQASSQFGFPGQADIFNSGSNLSIYSMDGGRSHPVSLAGGFPVALGTNDEFWWSVSYPVI